MGTAFGIGCFQFRYSDDDRMDGFDPVQFKTDLLSAFEKVENISGVGQEGLDFGGLGFRSFEEDEEGNVFPVVVGFNVFFTIFIPKKVQIEDHTIGDIETFYVEILYGYEKPVTLVGFKSDIEDDLLQGSRAVILVREYIKSKLGHDFIFGIVGPSPFHADFLKVASPDGPDISEIVSPGEGYAAYDVQIEEGPTNRPLATASNFLNPIFARYYYLQSTDIAISQARRSIVNGTRELLHQGPVSLWTRLKGISFDRYKIDLLQSEIVEERLLRTHASNFIAECERQGGLGGSTVLEKHFAEFRDSISEKEWSEFGDVARFFEERRLRFLGNINAIAAGVLGGIVGALIGAAATTMITGNGVRVIGASLPPPEIVAETAPRDTARTSDAEPLPRLQQTDSASNTAKPEAVLTRPLPTAAASPALTPGNAQ